jgi:hypothetical protein
LTTSYLSHGDTVSGVGIESGLGSSSCNVRALGGDGPHWHWRAATAGSSQLCNPDFGSGESLPEWVAKFRHVEGIGLAQVMLDAAALLLLTVTADTNGARILAVQQSP